MKHFKLILFLCGTIGIAAVGCKKSNSVDMADRVLVVEDLSHSACKTNAARSSEREEYLEYHTVDSNYLYIKHVNASLNCCPDSIMVYSSIYDGKLQYLLCNKNNNCNCNCLYDVICKIGPLDYASYSMVVGVCTGSSAEIKIDFNDKTEGRIVIKNLSE